MVRQLERLRDVQNFAFRGRKGPPTDEERTRLEALAKRGRVLADRETKLRQRGI